MRPRILLHLFPISAVAVGWWLYAQRIAPLQRSETAARAAIAELGVRTDETRVSLKAVKDLQQQTGGIRAELQRLHGDIAADSAIAWFPQRLKTHFAGFGLPGGATRMVNTQDEPDLPGYRRSYWAVALPIKGGNRTIDALLLAIEGLEREAPFVKVVDCVIQPDQEDPGQYTASMQLSALVQK